MLLLGGILGLLDTSIVNVGIETISRELDSTLKTVQWVATAYLLALSAAVPLGGWALDRFGGRKLWFTGLIVFIAGSVLCALSWNIHSLIGFRVLQGIGAGLLEPPLLDIRLFQVRGFSAGVSAVFLNAFLAVLPAAARAALPPAPARSRGDGRRPAPGPTGRRRLAQHADLRGAVRPHRWPRHHPGGALFTVVGLAGFALLGPGVSTGVLILFSFLTGLGLGAIAAPAMSAAFGSVPPSAVPSATAAVYLANQIGGSLGVAFSALLLQNLRDSGSLIDAFQGTFRLLLPVAVLVAVAGLALPGIAATTAPRPQESQSRPAPERVSPAQGRPPPSSSGSPSAEKHSRIAVFPSKERNHGRDLRRTDCSATVIRPR